MQQNQAAVPFARFGVPSFFLQFAATIRARESCAIADEHHAFLRRLHVGDNELSAQSAHT